VFRTVFGDDGPVGTVARSVISTGVANAASVCSRAICWLRTVRVVSPSWNSNGRRGPAERRSWRRRRWSVPAASE
jgi:hypothetical protein